MEQETEPKCGDRCGREDGVYDHSVPLAWPDGEAAEHLGGLYAVRTAANVC